MSFPIVYCMMQQNNLYETSRVLDRVSPFVDDMVVVDGGSCDGSIFYLRNRDDVRMFLHPWKDHFSDQRNNYLRGAENVVKQSGHDGDFIIICSDPDEIFDFEALYKLRDLVDEMLAKGCNVVTFRCISETLEGERVVWSNKDNYYKNLMYYYDVKNPPKYINNPHETLIINGGQKIMRTECIYRHRKQKDIIFAKGARNMYIGGGGPNLSTKNPRWLELRGVISTIYGRVLSWHEFEKELMKGDIDKRILEWMIKYHNVDGFDGASEHRELFKYYRILHPEDVPEELRDKYIE